MAKFYKNGKNDTGMEEVKEMVDKLPMSITKNIPGKSFLSIFQELSLKSSSTSLFQVINEDLLEDLAAYCKGNKEKNFVTGLENFALQTELRNSYPVITKIILDIQKDRSGMLISCVGELLASIVQHSLDFYKSLNENDEADYEQRKEEIYSEVYPQWEIRFEKAKYAKSCTSQDDQAWDKLCTKCFPSHQSLTPGLFIVTCACPNKSIYGFTMMVKHESPGMIFDITTTRFDPSYNPVWVYDAACKAKEYGPVCYKYDF